MDLTGAASVPCEPGSGEEELNGTQEWQASLQPLKENGVLSPTVILEFKKIS